MNKFDIYPLEESDWQAYRSLRLQSLQDSPDSFGSTYEREVDFSEDQWKARLRSASSNLDAMLWVATVGSVPIGLVSSVVRASEPKISSLYQMWVAPDYRGLGVGAELIEQVKCRAMEMNVEAIMLSVTSTNVDAMSLYEKTGFILTGSPERLRDGCALRTRTMICDPNSSKT